MIHTFSQVQGLAAAVEGVDGEFDLIKITGMERPRRGGFVAAERG